MGVLLQDKAPGQVRLGLGIGLMLLAAILSTGLSASAKWLLTEASLPEFEVVFARYAVHFAIVVVVFVPTRGTAVFRSRAPKMLLLRSAFLIAGTVLNFLALKHLPLTLTTVIMFAGPILITILAIPVLGEKVGSHRLVAVIVGFVGVMVIVQPGGTAFQPEILYSIGAVVAASLYYIMTRALAGVDSNASIQLWSSGLGAVAFLPFCIADWVWPDSTTGLVVLGLMGLCGALAHLASTAAHQAAPASALAPFIYAQIISASALGYAFFGETLSTDMATGCALIISSGLYLWWRERVKRTAG